MKMENQTLPAAQNEPAVVKYQCPKHSPGPWRVDVPEESSNAIDIRDSRGKRIADLLNERNRTPLMFANAELIAAAPDMLAALQTIRTRLGIRDDFVPLGAALDLAPIVEAAIRKATGAK